MLERLCTCWDRHFFLVPLQVFNDAQIFGIPELRLGGGLRRGGARPFARHAPADTALVIKHHPMSRGYTD